MGRESNNEKKKKKPTHKKVLVLDCWTSMFCTVEGIPWGNTGLCFVSSTLLVGLSESPELRQVLLRQVLVLGGTESDATKGFDGVGHPLG